MEKDNAIGVLNRFVAELAIPVTRQSVREELQRHAETGSLFALSDVLNKWHVPNAAYHLDFDLLVEVPIPFIAHISKKEFAVVTQLNEKQVKISTERWNNKKLSMDEFKKIYSGTILAAEKEEGSGEPDYAKKNRKEIIEGWRMPIVIVGLLIILTGFLSQHSTYLSVFSIQTALLTVFKTIGLTTSILLLIQSIDNNNPLVQKLCSGENNKDCNAILSSKAAKITDELSWSEVGFFYFAGTWLVLLFGGNHHIALMQVLAIINIISLPYTFYSIHYQWRVTKQWCVFCCAIQALLWLEFFAFLSYLRHGLRTPNLSELTTLISCMAMPVLVWMLIKPWLLKSNQVDPLKKQLYRFKYNTDLFIRLLNDESKYTLLSDDHSLIIGNRESENIITMVSNPYCQPCAKAHKALDELMSARKDVKLQVLFSTINRENDNKTKVAAHLMSLQANQNDYSLEKALSEWYGQKHKNYEVWAEKHPAIKKIAVKDSLEKQREWCELTGIKGTPTLYINGRKLPQYYQPEDLKYLI